MHNAIYMCQSKCLQKIFIKKAFVSYLLLEQLHNYLQFVYTFSLRNFTHCHKTLEGELESNMGYVEHRPSHYFDFVHLKLKKG